MIKSKYTFFVDKGEDIIVMNYLSGAIDLIEKNEVAEFKQRFKDNDWEDYANSEYMMERKYLFAAQEDEDDFIQERYLEFQDEYDQTAVQLIFSVTYACNFTCSYCFQEEYNQNSRVVTPEITDAFFQHTNKKFASEKVKPYITLFGGEPLLAGGAKKNILYFLEQAKRFSYGVAIVTNGYELQEYIPEFKRTGVEIKELQVTLDGDQKTHDSRRFTKPGIPSFEKIAGGIDMALQSGYRINLRSIIDKDNIDALPSLAKYADERGWLDYDDSLFQSTLGRNYELHTCQKTASLYERAEMWKDFYALSQLYPVLNKYHKPQFHGMRYLSETGELPFPIFDGCPAGKKEFAFDLNGDIYGCTASVGVKNYKLGSFTNPEEPANTAQANEWATRDVLSIPECSECEVSLSCGGGCGVLACNSSGKIHSPDCRPVKDLVKLGVDYYKIADLAAAES